MPSFMTLRLQTKKISDLEQTDKQTNRQTDKQTDNVFYQYRYVAIFKVGKPIYEKKDGWVTLDPGHHTFPKIHLKQSQQFMIQLYYEINVFMNEL